MSLYRALLLDFGGVCLKTPFELHDQVEDRLGIPRGTLDWLGPLDPTTDDLWEALQVDEISEREYWARRAATIGEVAGREITLRDYMHLTYEGPYESIMRPEAIAAVRKAKARGLRTGVLTNDMGRFHGPEWVGRIELLDEVDAVVDASDTGVLKPDPRAYRMALEALEVPAQRALFVDDQIRNVQGAREIGMDAVWFDPAYVETTWKQVDDKLYKE